MMNFAGIRSWTRPHICESCAGLAGVGLPEQRLNVQG